jgi:hypothetical protein
MASLNAALALTALADVDVELAVNGLARDLDLELLGDVGLVEGAAAIGADLVQRRLVDLVDLLGAGRLAVGPYCSRRGLPPRVQLACRRATGSSEALNKYP